MVAFIITTVWKPNKRVVKRLLKVRDVVLEEPRRFDMSDWINVATSEEVRQFRKVQTGKLDKETFLEQYDFSPRTDNDSLEIQPPCGTAGCLAGWLVLNNARLRHKSNDAMLNYAEISEVSDRALELLEITDDNVRAAVGTTLFSSGSWPSPFDKQYRSISYNQSIDKKRQRLKQNAKAVAGLINHIVKNGLTVKIPNPEWF